MREEVSANLIVRFTIAVENCHNIFGKLDDSIVERLLEFLKYNDRDSWQDVHSIILNSGKMATTVWQNVIAVNPSFPRIGPRTNEKGIILRDWSEIPDRETFIKAIENAALPS